MVSSHLTPIIIAGATASGKSGLALKLALKHGGEIICADSRQFYKFMRIGTASPSDEEMRMVPHHGYNFVDPQNQKIDAGFFIDFVKKHIILLQKRKVRPIIVGGTGLYLRALRFGLSDVPRSDPEIISLLEQECLEHGLGRLYERLLDFDPESTVLIKASDKYRIMRALAILQQTKEKPSSLRQSFAQKIPQIKAHWLLNIVDKANLEARIRARVKVMFASGLLEEACALRSILSPAHWALDVMGYKEALLYADKIMSYENMIEQVVIRHRQYAKRQLSWFKKEEFYNFKIKLK